MQSDDVTAAQSKAAADREMSCSVLPMLVILSPALFFLLMPDASVALWEDYKHVRHSSELYDNKHECTWKCLVFVLQWPGGFCLSLYNETHCKIPPDVNNWTIHGLWPLGVQSCCSCWPMFHSDVQELKENLTEYWPSLLTSRSPFQFWKEEWKKHGVCAACVEGFNSPLKYFQICLKLRQHFDIYTWLEAAGITPSCQQLYKVVEVSSVLAPHLGDKHEIQCVTDHKGREVLFQVKARLTQNLTVGCNHHGNTNTGPAAGSGPGPHPTGHPCPSDVPFYFFPINHQQPWRPCS
ncbi:ribonuclease T2-like [Kryptolebias marmoratus]|uniref:ribonuclease T2-like n=1 Tax=Kryptolebias marmoratus TaxID=37003 RepID=UPI0018ACCFB7|nr:ribonuclease T2-like [Kryptolebias marmoratus]